MDRDFQNITSIQGVLELSSFDQCGFFFKFFFENLRNVIFCYNIKSSSQNLQLQNRLREHTPHPFMVIGLSNITVRKREKFFVTFVESKY